MAHILKWWLQHNLYRYIWLFLTCPRQRIDNFLFDSYYSTSWKNNYFIVVEFLEFLRYFMTAKAYLL